MIDATQRKEYVGVMSLAKLLTIPEVAEYLRLNPFTVYRMAERGELAGAKIARRWRFSEADLRAWLARHTSAGTLQRRRRAAGGRRHTNT